MQTLQQTEQTKDVEPLVALFSEDAEFGNLIQSQPLQGKAAIRMYWQEYLATFGQVHSEFEHVVEGEKLTVLEWTSTGTLPSGKPMSYRGVSILEFQGEQVQRFRTYFDSAAFVPRVPH